MELNNAAQSMGRKGGKSRSPAKLAAVRENGKRGGRPPKTVVANDGQFMWPTTQRQIDENPDCPGIAKRYDDKIGYGPGSQECIDVCNRLISEGADIINVGK